MLDYRLTAAWWIAQIDEPSEKAKEGPAATRLCSSMPVKILVNCCTWNGEGRMEKSKHVLYV